jgi:hypothetical protein
MEKTEKKVTLDRVLKSIQQYSGDQTRDQIYYEIARQGLPIAEEQMEITKEALKAETGFDEMNLPEGIEYTLISKGDVVVSIKSSQATKKPSYKSAVTEWEHYLIGTQRRVSRGVATVGIAKEKSVYMISAEKLLDEFYTIVEANRFPGVRHTIDFDVKGNLATEQLPDELETKGRKGFVITDRSLADYVRMERFKAVYENFMQQYESELTPGKPGMKLVSEEQGYNVEKTKAQGPDWYNVVRSMVSIEDLSKGKKTKKSADREPDVEGELNILADHSISLAEKRRMFDNYDLMYRESNGERKVYVSLQSVYDRLQTLKDSDTITAKRTRISLADNV